MSTILVKNIACLNTMVPGARPLEGASLFVRDRRIESIHERGSDLPEADTIIDGSDLLIMPGLINTHHHFYQTLTRNVPGAQDAKLFDWLTFLYDRWANLTPEALASASRIAAAELIRSGCTTAVDHFYLYPKNDSSLFDVEVDAVGELGLRLHLCRGSMSLSKKDGGLPPDSVVQCDDEILRHSQEAVQRHHDYDRYGMVRVIISPCSPFSVTSDLMRETKKLADELKVQVHTHLAETEDENDFCLEMFGMRPTAYLDSLGWIDSNAFYAHTIWLDDDEIALLAARGAGASHCPTSNMRLGSGIAPIVPMLKAGVKVSLAVDGSASNDSSHMIDEMRNALLLQRVKYGSDAFTADEALALATRGGAGVLDRDDIGNLAPDMAADFIGIRLDDLSYAGALHDPARAPVFCHTSQVDLSVINGKIRMRDGAFVDFDVEKAIAEQNVLAKKLVEGC